MKILLMPDSFKGSLTAKDFCDISRRVLERHFPGREIIKIPMADGGEGTVDCFLSLDGFEQVSCTARGAYLEPLNTSYAVKGTTAVIEMARAASLPSVAGREDPSKTSTAGVGDMIRDAVNRGAKRIVLGLGGSCTNDAGCGMAHALGTVFRDSGGKEFLPVGGDLDRVASIDTSRTEELLRGIEILGMCDISNPLYGENGAAYVFAPQKGADRETVKRLDSGLRSISDTWKALGGEDLSLLPGSGAAGGLGWGVAAFLAGSLRSGTDLVLDTIGFEDLLEGTSFVLTGEGHLDSQSLAGKTVIGIARRASARGIPVIALCGGSRAEEGAYEEGVSAVFTTNFEPSSLDEAKDNVGRNLSRTVENISRLIETDIYGKEKRKDHD